MAFSFFPVHNGGTVRWNSQTEEGAPAKKSRALALGLLGVGVALGVSRGAQKGTATRLPYTAIHDPQFISASEATFLHDPDRVIGIMSGNVAKAYPAAILSQHGLVEDQSPTGSIAITW